MDLLAALNGRIIAKLFDLSVPVDMQPHICLIVMGSEGRDEQIMKTDQDNALIYRDNLVWPEMHSCMQQFSERLISFGFPPCPGNIMVSNPEWINSVGDWTQKLSDWADTCEGTALMKLAIAVDAKPVAGNEALFKVARNWFLRHLRNNEVFFSHFARAAIEFNTPLTFFGHLKERGQLDIKKGGIFPIVHGYPHHRAGAANPQDQHLPAHRCAGGERTDAAQHGRDLSEALALCIQLRLRQQIRRAEESPDGTDPTPNMIDLQQLNKLERELLRDALHVVKGFKKHLTTRYHLEG